MIPNWIIIVMKLLPLVLMYVSLAYHRWFLAIFFAVFATIDIFLIVRELVTYVQNR